MYRDDENGVIIQRKEALERDDVEVICVEVTTQRKESFLLVAACVPPEKKEQLEGLLTVIDKCKKDHKNIIITGRYCIKRERKSGGAHFRYGVTL